MKKNGSIGARNDEKKHIIVSTGSPSCSHFFVWLAYMLLEAIFEWGDKIGWIRAFLNIVDL